ncbi:hypothetical protein, partial [Pseudoalteromonas sp. MQS005]|uniref:hypothetical protein n=1 Tax=Pseudoalteromonas sp. MQS005 TaxID=1854052 RepID=UPI001E60FE5A
FLFFFYNIMILLCTIINVEYLTSATGRTFFIYVFGFCVFMFFNLFDSHKLDGLFKALSFTLILLGVAQFIIPELLPLELRYVPSLVEPYRLDSFWLGGNVYYKPNGAVGNPIEFAVFCILSILFILYRKESIGCFSIFDKILLVTSFTAILFTLSRLGIALALIVLIFYFMLSRRAFYKKIALFSFLFLLIVLSFAFKDDFQLINAIWSRFDGSDELAKGSNLEHAKDYKAVVTLLLSSAFHFLLGYGVGYNNANNVITDGLLFIIALDLGMIGLTLFSLLLTFPVLMVNNITALKYILLLLFVFYISSFVNSAFLNKTVYFSFMFIVSHIIIRQKQPSLNG